MRAPAVARPWVDALRLHLPSTETCMASRLHLSYAKQFSVGHRDIEIDHNVVDDFGLLVEGPSLEEGIREY